MFGTQKTHVLVVGAGPVGMFSALSLAERGLNVEIIDAQWRPAARSYALALHPHTIELLAGLGLADTLLAKAHMVDRLAFYNNQERCGHVSYAELDTPYPYLAVLPQQELEDALEARLKKSGVKIRWNHRLARLDQRKDVVTSYVHKLDKDSLGYATATTAWVVAKEIEYKSEFVIGADGHQSLVRRITELPFEDLGGTQTFAVFEFTADSWDIHEARVVFTDETTNVLWPLGGGRYRWSFQIDPSHGESTRPKSRLSVQLGDDSYKYLDREVLGTFIAARAPWFKANVEQLAWSLEVRFERRLVERLGRGRVWLAGDAAHLSTPLGVHSMNIGMREGHELADLMADIWQGEGTTDGLSMLGARTVAEWRQLFNVQGAITASDDAPTWARDHQERIAAAVPASGAHRNVLLAQLGLHQS